MRLIQLTDFYRNKPEYLDADDVARVEAHDELESDPQEETKTVGRWWWKRTVTNTVYVNHRIKSGSQIFMKGTNKNSTCVSETPEQVVKLIKGE